MKTSEHRRVGVRELGRILGKSPAAVVKAVKEGRITKGADGKFDPEEARRQWEANTLPDPRRETRRASRESFTTARARKETAVAQLREYELAEKQARVVTLEYMEQQVAAILRQLRARILNIPGKWAPAMVGLRSVGEAQPRLEQLSHELIVDLSEVGDITELDDVDTI